MNQGDTQAPRESMMDRMRSTLNLFVLASSVFSAFAEVTFFRTRFGERYFQGWKTGLVVPLLILFPSFFPTDDPRPLWCCLPLYVVMCARHRLGTARRRARGETGGHSLYNGESRLQKRYPHVSEIALKSRHEPAVMLVMGIGAMVVSPPMGWFFICCSVSMAVYSGLLAAHERQRRLDLSDAHIEGQILMGSSSASAAAGFTSGDAVVRIHRSVVTTSEKV